MSPVIVAIVSAAVGGAVTYAVSRLLHERHKPSRRIKVIELQSDGLNQDDPYRHYETRPQLPASKRQACSSIVYHIIATGNDVIRDLRVRVSCVLPCRLAAFHYWVHQQIICDRLTIHSEPPDPLLSSWTYLNPGDVITLHVLVAGPADRTNVDLEIDGEGVEVIRTPPMTNCEIVEPRQAAG